MDDFKVDDNIKGYLAQEMLCTPETPDMNEFIEERIW